MKLSELKLLAASENIAAHLSEDELSILGQTCYTNYRKDKVSRAKWEEKQKKSLDIAKQVLEEKSFPWANCANTNYPLITVAAIQFNARAYPAIINSQMVVKGEVIGADPAGAKTARAARIGKHMSYQYLFEQEEWETDTDRLLISLPILGDMFRKTYFNPNIGCNSSRLILPMNLVYDYDTPFEKVTRKTEVFELSPNEIEERKRNNIYLDVDLGLSADEVDEEKPQKILEQHCLYDFDQDGYKEPYIITFTEENHKILRIKARFDFEFIYVKEFGEIKQVRNVLSRKPEDFDQLQVVSIKPIEYYTNYFFIPSPDGKGYNLGLGELLENINEQVKTVLNQLIDAGTLANQQGGFIAKGLRIKKGKIAPSLNEFIPVDVMSGMNLRENLVPFDFKGPSVVLFQLLGFLVDAARDISSVKDIMTGESQGANESPTVYVSRINEGLKVFSAIFKRIHSSLKKEFRKQFRLNNKYLQPTQYFRVMDEEIAVKRTDYMMEDIDVLPVSDPTMATMAQKVAVNQALNQMYRGDPSINQEELKRRTMESMDVSGIDKLVIPQDQIPQPPPDPKAIEAQAKMMLVEPQAKESMAKVAKITEELKEVQVRTASMIEEVEKARETNDIITEQEREKLAGIELDNLLKAQELNEKSSEMVKIIQDILNKANAGTD